MNHLIPKEQSRFFAFGFFGIAFLLGGLFSGVRSEVKIVGPTLPAKPPTCEVEILENTKPTRGFETVAQIDVYVRRNKVTMGRQAVYEEAVPELKKQACRVGADGVIVLRQTVSRNGEFKLLYVKSEAFHYIAEPPPTEPKEKPKND